MVTFKGFGGVALEAEVAGGEDDPAILIVAATADAPAPWERVADALVQAGRRAIRVELPLGEAEDIAIAHLQAMLAQLGSRPVVVAGARAAWLAAAALTGDAAHLAAGLVLVDLACGAECDRAEAIASDLALPTLVVRGGFAPVPADPVNDAFVRALQSGEVAEIEAAELQLVTDRGEAFLGLLLDFLERKQPRAGSEFRGGSDARTLRDAMGCFATGITIVTALEQGRPIGLTANSFTSVSLEPPLLLVCIAETAGSGRVLREAAHFGVNVLQIGQQPASSRFAGKDEDRFAATAWAPGETGVPVLGGSLVSFECKRHAVHEGGDHFILVGEVVRAQFEPRRDPLLYFRGKYRRLHFA
jgi:flavin reductase (DIM6/NTAB) family NADH-FMN oxidoreductase RutF